MDVSPGGEKRLSTACEPPAMLLMAMGRYSQGFGFGSLTLDS